MELNASARLLAADQADFELEAGVTWDAFKGWASGKKKAYLDEHPNSTFFDRLGITDREDREHEQHVKRAQKVQHRLQKQHGKIKDAEAKEDLQDRIRAIQKHIDTREANHAPKLGFFRRRRMLKKLNEHLKRAIALHKSLLKDLRRAKDARTRELLKAKAESAERTVEKLRTAYKQLMTMKRVPVEQPASEPRARTVPKLQKQKAGKGAGKSRRTL